MTRHARGAEKHLAQAGEVKPPPGATKPFAMSVAASHAKNSVREARGRGTNGPGAHLAALC